MMRIAMVTKRMLLGYGIDEVVHMLSKEMAHRGYEVSVITTRREIRPEGYRVVMCRPLPIPSANPYWQAHFLLDFRSAMPVIKILKDYEIVVTFDPMHLIGAMAKLTLRMPVFMYYFGVVPPNVLNSLTRKLESIRQMFIWNASFGLADYIMTNSKYTKGILPKCFMSRAVVNYHGIEHMINQNKRKAEEFREKLNIRGKKLLLSVGRFSSPYKDMSGMVKLFNRLKRRIPDIALLLVGRGSSRDVETFSRLEDIFVLTNIPNEMLTVCFASCDVYCSASKWEGFNIPLVAAQANGKPVVAYKVGAHPEVVIDKKTGFLAETAREFNDHLELLVEDDRLRERMGRKAVEHTKKFAWDSSAELLENVVRKVSGI